MKGNSCFFSELDQIFFVSRKAGFSADAGCSSNTVNLKLDSSVATVQLLWIFQRHI